MKLTLTIIFVLAGLVLCDSNFIWKSSAQQRAKAFSHNTIEHKNGRYTNCSVCHQLPTPNWALPRRDKQLSFPDVINFPNPHKQGAGNICFACHSPFSGGGVLCGTCHTVPSMRARAVLPFPVQGRARQFSIIFPHDVHQDLIAKDRKYRRNIGASGSPFVRASFDRSAGSTVVDDPYSCAVCHQTAAQIPKSRARTIPDLKPLGDLIADTLAKPVTASFFKSSPDGHASCFNCHYQYQHLPKEKQTCAGCHELTRPYIERTTIERYSLKFDHSRQGHVEYDCATCHVRITQHSSVTSMKDADVPVATCWRCHATQEETPWKRVLLNEIAARETSVANKQPAFQCTYCHTSAIGRYEIPDSHRPQ